MKSALGARTSRFCRREHMPRLRFGVLCFVCSVFAVAVGVWGPVQAQNGPEAVQNLEETGPL